MISNKLIIKIRKLAFYKIKINQMLHKISKFKKFYQHNKYQIKRFNQNQNNNKKFKRNNHQINIYKTSIFRKNIK